MIQTTFDQTERRMFSFPAVHPCEAVSPVTLLRSLIILSQNISNHQSKSFATQRRNTRETIRQIGILVVFFEEIHDRGLVVPESAVLCFSELHLTFQKIRFLLEDCSREGARLWILMKSEMVASQFRVLIRTVATALDVLPLDLVDVCGEVKELVELVTKQARKAKIEVDPDDERAMRRVLSVLDRFEKGIEPEFQILKRILDYLEIKTWSDCNKEIRFLEEQCVEGEEREVPFLSTLLGFMCYCRGRIFDTLDGQNVDQTDVRCNMEILSCLNPEDFRCPISLELMIDPVTVSTGQTYDRSSIHKWLKAGHTICPKTGEKLTSTELVPNTNLRKLIHQFCADHGVSLAKTGKKSRDITRTIVPGSPAAAEAMKFLSKLLGRKLIFGPSEQKNKAAYEIRLLAKSNIYNRSCLIEAGTIPPLLNLLYSFNKSMQENAIGALLKLSKHASGKKVMVESGGLRSIVAVLKRGMSLEARQIAAATIFYLSSVKGYRKLIGEMDEAIPALVDLIKEGTPCGRKNAVVALFGLVLYPGNRQRAIDSGTVPLLLETVASLDKHELVTDSVALLATLAESFDGTFEILRASSLPLITRILQTSTSQAAKEHCVSILLCCCNNGGDEAISVLAKDPSVMSSLYSLTTDGTAQASKKARSLIKILHKFHETSSSGQGCQAFTHEQSVHVW
ncbi:plant U-box 19 [Hibiscus trionum]|uniref:RING-type E3 ubiquitin transferase n=1 Tax=Hibiscus trionum TaxID=183268 RepID=A0A9W7INT9_HIBTR|nr:plant U-box 19 [Hibiscus trionum]